MPGDSVNINNKATAQNTYDAIVVGSGISGGWAAKELTEKGLSVLMLERGRNFEHIKDYASAKKDPWEFKHRGRETVAQKEVRPVISRKWGASEPIMDYWANEQDCPYTEVKPFNWWRSYQVGGRSILWVVKVIAGVILILKPMQKTVGPSTGLYVTVILHPGMTMLKNLQASVVQKKDWRNCPTDSFFHPWI